MQEKSVFNQFQRFLENMNGDFHVLEQRVPVELQMEYFNFSNRLRKAIPRLSDADYERFVAQWNDPNATKEQKQLILSTLAISKQAKAYGILKRFAEEGDKELADWAYMALMESRMTLETELSDEKQIYISTGLGGEGQRLRFYILLLSATGQPFADYQRQVIEREFSYALPKEDCKIERLSIREKYAEMLLLIPVRADIRYLLEKIISECNQYGNFLSDSITVTNVKELNEKEIARIMRKYESIQARR